jgi:hypothetical protein
MNNLACSHNRTATKIADTNEAVRSELAVADIPSIACTDLVENSEVPTNLTGKLGDFTFNRLWTYWSAHGKVPLAVAEELYATEVGRKSIRANGDCGCPAPAEKASTIELATGRTIVDDEEYDKGIRLFKDKLPKALADWETNFMPASKAGATAKFVMGFHIDTLEALVMFTRALRKHNLVPA